MEIVFLLNLNTNYGGGDYSIFKFAEALSKLNNKITVFYSGNKNITHLSFNPNFKVYSRCHFPLKLKGKGIINNLITAIHDAIYLHPYLNKNRSNINFIAGYQIETALKAEKLAQKYNLKKVNFIFETPNWLMEKWPSWKGMYETNIKARNEWNKYKQSLLSADLIIANSKLTSQKAKEWIGETPDLVVYPGIPENLKTSDAIKKKQQIIYVGRLESNKNIDEIIKALQLLRSNLKLVIIGTGSEEDKLKKLATDCEVDVCFKGKVKDDIKWEEIQSSLVMVFPSSFEGFGMPPMEALLMKTPCICSNIPILKEVYNDNVDYFNEHNVEQLAGLISHLTNNTSLLNEKGEKGYNYIIDSFGWDKSAKLLNTTLLKSLLN